MVVSGGMMNGSILKNMQFINNSADYGGGLVFDNFPFTSENGVEFNETIFFLNDT